MFIIVEEVFSRVLNSLHTDTEFKRYVLPKWTFKINRLSYADDTILFCSGDRGTLIKMMKIQRDYEDVVGREDVVGQMVNKATHFF